MAGPGEIRVQDEQGNIHVFPGEATPEMIAQAMNVKPPARPQLVQPQPTETIGNQPTGILPWLKNVESDFRYGGQQTFPGKILHLMGAQGVNVGAQSGAADTIASPILGPLKAAQGVAELPSHPGQGLKHIFGGALQAATLPASFVAPSTSASDVVPEAAEAVRAGIYGKVPFLGRAFASKAAAGKNFQEVMGAAKDVPVSITDNLSEALSRYQELVDSGGSRSLSVSKLLNRVTSPDRTPLTYKEARDFYSNISRLSANEAQRLTPQMKQQVGAVRAALNEAIQGTASQAGKGAEYGSAMKEFAQASRNAETAKKVAKAGIKYAVPAAGAAYLEQKLVGK